MKLTSFPASVQADIEKAIAILKAADCTEGYIFGSVARGGFGPKSDIDIAVRGLAPSLFFKVYGKLALSLSTPIDLVDLDEPTSFAAKLIERGEMIRVL